ncbi:MAG TPA: hypothetical protein VFD70_11400 [Anaerolineae bacterium]|nr:hypothetical protein [Anaerolineae bacterium]
MSTSYMLRTALGIALGALLALLIGYSAGASGNGISSPTANEQVYGNLAVRGVADAPDFLAWQLDILPGGNPEAAFQIAKSKTKNTRDDVLTRFDTTTLPDGAYSLRLRVIHINGQYDEFFVPFLINNTNPPPTPTKVSLRIPKPTVAPPNETNTISSPSNGSHVSGTIRIIGAVDSPDFVSWKLDLLPSGQEDRSITIGAGRTPIPTADVLTELDTSLLPNGLISLRLRVAKENGTFTESVSSLTIDNPNDSIAKPTTDCSPTLRWMLPQMEILFHSWLDAFVLSWAKVCEL